MAHREEGRPCVRSCEAVVEICGRLRWYTVRRSAVCAIMSSGCCDIMSVAVVHGERADMQRISAKRLMRYSVGCHIICGSHRRGA